MSQAARPSAPAPFVFHQGTAPLLISIPHSGVYLPPLLAERLGPEAREVPDTDWHLERLYDFAKDMGASILAATVVSFLVAALLFGFGRGNDVADEVALPTAHDEVLHDSGATLTTGATGTTAPAAAATVRSVNGSDVKQLIIACDAGMGSSVMVAGAMKKKLAPYGVTVVHSPVNEVPTDAELVMCQSGLAPRVRGIVPEAVVVTFVQFVGDPAFARVEQAIRQGETIE